LTPEKVNGFHHDKETRNHFEKFETGHNKIVRNLGMRMKIYKKRLRYMQAPFSGKIIKK